MTTYIFVRHLNVTNLAILILPVLLMTSTAFAKAMTLEDAIVLSLQNNPELHQYPLNRQRLLAERDSKSMKSGYLLNIDIENFAGSGTMDKFDNAEYTLALSSVIEFGDKRNTRISVVDSELDHVNHTHMIATLDLLGRLTSEFVNGLALQEKEKLANVAVTLAQDLLKTVSKRASQGAGSDVEMLRARANLVQKKIELASLNGQLERQHIKLGALLGKATPSFNQLHGSLFMLESVEDYDVLFERVNRSPAIEILASKSRLKTAEVQLARSAGNADLDWQVGLRHIEENDDTALVLGLSVPLFSSERSQSRVKLALAEYEMVDVQRQQKLLALHKQLYNAWSQQRQHVNSFEQLQQHVIPTLEQALALTRKGYERGRLRYQDWITAQEELLDARHQLIDSATNAQLNQGVIEQLTASPLNP